LFGLLRNVSSKALNMVLIFVSFILKKGQGLRPFTAHTYLSELCYTTLYTIAMQQIFKLTRVITFCLDTLERSQFTCIGTAISGKSHFTSTVVSANCAGAVCIHVTAMTSSDAFIDI